MKSVEEFLNSEFEFDEVKNSRLTAKQNYNKIYRFVNLTSHSIQEVLHRCPREFLQLKNLNNAGHFDDTLNLDFIFGHAVGAGVQNFIVNENLTRAFFTSFLTWSASLDDEIPTKKKSFFWTMLAISKFADLWRNANLEIAIFNNRPAIELSFLIDCENGFFHVGHVDAIVRNRTTGLYSVLELKTTSSRTVNEAQYGNSDQALGYSVVLDAIAAEASTFDVLYYVYSTTQREWTVFSFRKSRVQRAEWLNNLLLDHATIKTYVDLKFFPRRGSSCWSFSRTCPHYSICHLKENSRTDNLLWWKPELGLPENFDFQFKLSDLAKVR